MAAAARAAARDYFYNDVEREYHAIYKLYYSFCKERNIDDAELKALGNHTTRYRNLEFIKGDHSNDPAPPLLGPMKVHPNAVVECSPELKDMISGLMTIPEDRMGRQYADKLLTYFQSAISLKELDRFTNKEHSPLLKWPATFQDLLKPEYNPENDTSLYREQRMRKLFIKLLHVQGILTRNNNDTWDRRYFTALCKIYGMGRLLHAYELGKNPVDAADHYTPNPNDDGYGLMGSIASARHDLQVAFAQLGWLAHNPFEVPTLASRFFAKKGVSTIERKPKEQTLQENLARDEFLRMLLEKFEESIKPNPFLRIVLDLLEKKDSFELALTAEHVEDRLINKQLSYFDDMDLPMKDFRTMFTDQRDQPESAMYWWDVANIQVLADISLINLQRRNFRLFRDWHMGRPWWRMTYVYDSRRPGNEWLSDAITAFVAFVTDFGIKVKGRATPSSYKNVIPHLFGIYPMDQKHVDIEKVTCVVCNQPPDHTVEGFSSSNIFLDLRCLHKGHVHCLFDLWDRPGKIVHQCPKCKKFSTPGWKKARVDPKDSLFVHNLNDYRRNYHPHYRRDRDEENYSNYADFNIPEYNPFEPERDDQTYWRRENALVNSLQNLEVDWIPHYFAAGRPLSMLLKGEKRIANTIDIANAGTRWTNQAPWDRISKSLREKWVDRCIEDGRDFTAPDRNTARKLVGAKHGRYRDAAAQRRKRRERDLKTREEIRESRKGLAGWARSGEEEVGIRGAFKKKVTMRMQEELTKLRNEEAERQGEMEEDPMDWQLDTASEREGNMNQDQQQRGFRVLG